MNVIPVLKISFIFEKISAMDGLGARHGLKVNIRLAIIYSNPNPSVSNSTVKFILNTSPYNFWGGDVMP